MQNIIKGLLDVELVSLQANHINTLLTKVSGETIMVYPPGGSSNYVLAVYSILKAILNPNRRVVITAPSFRLIKLCFQHIEDIVMKGRILKKPDIQHAADVFSMKFLNGSSIVAKPINLSKICGQRPTDLIILNFCGIEKDIFESIISGFSVTSLNPIDILNKKPIEQNTRLILSEYDDVITNKFIKLSKDDPSVDLIECSKEDFPKGYFHS